MPNIDKPCVLCGESCVGHARIKNEKGQYAHQACAEQKNEQAHEQALVASEGEDWNDELIEGMDDLLGDIPSSSDEIGGANACPGCGQAMGDDAIVCMSCGYNRESGSQSQTKASKERVVKESKVAEASAAIVGSLANQLFYPVLGGCIGGAIGASIWSAVAYYGHIRFGILAWGIGLLVGTGVNIGSRDTGGVYFGLIGAIIAVGSVVGGNYLTATLLVKQYLEVMEPGDVSDDLAMSKVVVWEVLDEWNDRGDEIPWPKEWKAWELADWPNDFSRVIRDDTSDKWYRMSYDEQDSIRAEIAEMTYANSEFIDHEMIEIGFFALMMQPINIIWLVLAVGSAFSAAAYQ